MGGVLSEGTHPPKSRHAMVDVVVMICCSVIWVGEASLRMATEWLPAATATCVGVMVARVMVVEVGGLHMVGLSVLFRRRTSCSVT